MKIEDMPKLESPFVRVGADYLVTPKINPGYEWVFEDEFVTCQEKLDDSNVSVVIENGKITRVFNRENELNIWKNDPAVLAVREAYNRGYINLTDGQYFGEAIGERIQDNKYQIEGNIWLPYNTYFAEKLTYRTWGKYPKDFQTISDWFKDGLMSLFCMSRGNKSGFVDGVVFHHPIVGFLQLY